MSLSPRPNQEGSAPYPASSSLTTHVSPVRPQPRSVSIPPPRVYMHVSRSGQIRRPCIHTSSPVFTTAVTVCSDVPGPTGGSPRSCLTPSRNRAPPTPPTTTTTFTRPILARSPGLELGDRQDHRLPQVDPGRAAGDVRHEVGHVLGRQRPGLLPEAVQELLLRAGHVVGELGLDHARLYVGDPNPQRAEG